MILAASDLDIPQTERGLAELSIALLRDGGVTDIEILRDYTSKSSADHTFEQYYQSRGICIAASRVKGWMRWLLTS